jgi:arylsulfatase A-like enzyme
MPPRSHTQPGARFHSPRVARGARRRPGVALGAAFASCLALAAVGPRPASAQAARKPSFIVILTDDMNFDAIGPTHSPDGLAPVMPTIEALAAQGVRFTNAFVTTALCGPSRASLLTGRYAHETGQRSGGPEPWGGAAQFDDSSTIATWLQGAGYRTGLYGFYLFGLGQLPQIPRGWDEWHAIASGRYYDFVLWEDGIGYDDRRVRYPSGCESYTECPGDLGGCADPQNHQTDVLTAKALDFLDTQPADQPFLLYLSFVAPHEPACPEPEDAGTFAGVPLWRPPSWNEPDASDKPAGTRAMCPIEDDNVDALDEFRERQLETLRGIDRGVAAILQRLAARGRAQDTAVIFTSDNGFRWGEHCGRGKLCPYEECIRIPLVIRHPALGNAGAREARPVLLLDLAPTLAELAGVAPATPVDGLSLAPLLRGTPTAWRTDLLYEQWRKPEEELLRYVPPTLQLVREDEWKYVLYETGETELYDLLLDPGELQNRSGEPAWAAVEARLAARLREIAPPWGCADGFDGDGDGLVDFPVDPGCADARDLSERSAALVCDDGLDNDRDGAHDYDADSGCDDPRSPSELSACQDRLDDDGDGLVDLDDPGCPSASGTTENPASPYGFDVDGDGRSDALAYDDTTRELSALLLQVDGSRVAHVIGSQTGGKPAPVGWADVDGDGRADVLWRDPKTGRNEVWLLRGASFAQLELPAQPKGWAIAALRDFDRDGMADVLWHAEKSGESEVWWLDGLGVVGEQAIDPGPANHAVGGVADFDGDGSPDLLWRDRKTGALQGWRMNDATPVATVALPSVGAKDSLAGVGDLNGDGREDLLWLSSRGKKMPVLVAWFMRGVVPPAVGIALELDGLKLHAVADLDGDERVEILTAPSSSKLGIALSAWSVWPHGTPDAAGEIRWRTVSAPAGSLLLSKQTRLVASGLVPFK